jgi:SAM-dependent methyltransferase
MHIHGGIRELLKSVASWPSILWLRRLTSDRTLGLVPDVRDVLRGMQLDMRATIYGDRLREFVAFWRTRALCAVFLVLRHGVPAGTRFSDYLMSFFEGNTGPGSLMSAYRRSALAYSMRLMFSYQRGEWLAPFVGDILRHFKCVGSPDVLEYGCGVSDMGILLSMHGAKVTCVDLDTKRLDFVLWRYKRRGLPVQIQRVQSTEDRPKLEESAYDLVILSEILEHVRDPLELITSVHASLREGGLLFCTAGSSFERKVGGDHLAEAIAIGQGDEYQRFFMSGFELINADGRQEWLFKKSEARLPHR